jgi:hypothetical protein
LGILCPLQLVKLWYGMLYLKEKAQKKQPKEKKRHH